MRKALALIHSFEASSQLTDLLKSLQTKLPTEKKLSLTRYTNSMVVDLFYGRTTSQIRNIVTTIQDVHESITTNLTDEEWEM